MLYDASLPGQSQDDLFDLEAWRRHGTVEPQAGGRGAIVFLRDGARRWVLRHYRRGGAVARLLGDRYLYMGADRTRAFREWRLLRTLAALALPAPRPVAARYLRAGIFYTADLLTEELPSRLTLAQALAAGPLPTQRWADVGCCIGAFHARGVRHADLNAHNIVLGAGREVYLLDFDRGRIGARGDWEEAVLERLERSLRKVTRDLPPDRFGDGEWRALLDACRTA
jgi:3-deoxy-D-manno-octulosonic acid kinase